MSVCYHVGSSAQLSKPTKLNQGLPEQDYVVMVTIDVTDILGCFKAVSLSVKVNMHWLLFAVLVKLLCRRWIRGKMSWMSIPPPGA